MGETTADPIAYLLIYGLGMGARLECQRFTGFVQAIGAPE